MPMKIRVEEYIRLDESSLYRDWIDGLNAQAAAKVTTAKLPEPTHLRLG